jgi:Fur family transcriptional regulator, zinc uptake regulator
MRKASDVRKIMNRAEEYCRKRNLRLTEGRAAVLSHVVRSRRPVKAYDVLAAVSTGDRKPMPPIVYRALDFWTAHGFIHRIESLNAYTSCTHPGCGHECQLFICRQCGRVSEICDDTLHRQMRDHSALRGFEIEHLKVEATGRCPDCHEATASPAIHRRRG